jgi:hypothetical protein
MKDKFAIGGTSPAQYYRARVKVTIFQDVIVYHSGISEARDEAIKLARWKYPRADGFQCLPEDIREEGQCFKNGSKMVGLTTQSG